MDKATSRLRSVFGLIGLLALAATACGDEDKKDGDEELGDAGNGPTGEEKPPVDAGSRLDANVVTPVPTKDGGSESVDGTVPPPPPANNPDGGPAPLKPRVANGTPLAACYIETDCISDDLTCVSSAGRAGAGFCMDDCRTDNDCSVVAGVQSTCSTEGQCRFDCTGTGAGDGACPPDMICRDISATPLLSKLFRCTFPLGSGTKSTASYAECDVDHGNGDCADTGVCHVPVGGLIATPGFGPGYCAPTCTTDAECAVPAGATVVPTCKAGACELDCSGKGSVCPTGLDCRDVDESPLLTEYRCRSIN